MASELDATAYVRLPGRARRLSGGLVSGEAQRLYASADHLLVLRRVGYEETSKRYSLSDVQAITLQSNSDRTLISAVLAAIMLIFASLGLVAFGQGAGPFDFVMILIYTVVAVLGGVLTWNLALGPTCTVRLHTAVQIEDLTALRRLRAARRCLAILVPRIEAAQGGWQGGLPPLQSLAGSVSAAANTKLLRAKQAPKAMGRALHAAAFALATLSGLSLIAELVYESAWKDATDMLLVVAAIVLLLVAVIRQANSTLPRQVRAIAWSLFILDSFMFIGILYVTTFVVAFSAAAAGESPPIMTMGGIVFGQEDPRWLDMIVAAWGAVGVVLGLFGLLSIRGYRLVVRPLAADGGAPLP